MKWVQLPDFDMGGEVARVFQCGPIRVLISREYGFWHLSISRPDRYPNWNEIRDTRYELLPDNCTMAMMLPPKEEYVNLHKNCFHLHEVNLQTNSIVLPAGTKFSERELPTEVKMYAAKLP